MRNARHRQVSNPLHLLPLTRPTSSCRGPECEDSLHGQCVPTGVTAGEPRHHDSCNRMSLSSMFYRMSNILQYISLPSLLLPDQATTPTALRSSVTAPAGPPLSESSLRGEGRALSTALATWAGRLPAFRFDVFNLEN